MAIRSTILPMYKNGGLRLPSGDSRAVTCAASSATSITFWILGVNALYLNPIFLASSNHRYNASDYFQIDPRLGTLADFHALVEAVHKNDMRIILDGVFNHCGRGFFAFTDVLENGERSAYKDWFHIKQFPLDAYTQWRCAKLHRLVEP